jgi:hypothetical protein
MEYTKNFSSLAEHFTPPVLRIVAKPWADASSEARSVTEYVMAPGSPAHLMHILVLVALIGRSFRREITDTMKHAGADQMVAGARFSECSNLSTPPEARVGRMRAFGAVGLNPPAPCGSS